MFYSQFILAKKGPLGTIWIAAHLERKLRKNQVAETNIGVSVDSILFPEVPIALRLSGHLLLGVVRIYSKKVNYLFHDCSEALVKIKQAFHSTIVDLPPEAATAPFHSITLPETFDFDELELLQDPESSFVQPNGNFVDHNVTTREQITLQDPMEDAVYPGSSQFGLDERFVDGDSSPIVLDFDEDIFTEKLSSPVVRPPSPPVLKEDNSPSMTGHSDGAVRMDIADHHEPSTPIFNIDMTERETPGLEHIRADQQQNVPLDESVMPRVSSKDHDLFLSGDAMPRLNALVTHTQQVFEARTPDLNKEFCPPDEPSTPALPEETSLPIEQELPLISGSQERFFQGNLGGVERARPNEQIYTIPPSNQVSVVMPLGQSRQDVVVPAQSSLPMGEQHFSLLSGSEQSNAAMDLQQVNMAPQRQLNNIFVPQSATSSFPDQSFRLNPVQQASVEANINASSAAFQGFHLPSSVQQLTAGLYQQSGQDFTVPAHFSLPMIDQHCSPSTGLEQSMEALYPPQASMASQAQFSSMMTSQNASSSFLNQTFRLNPVEQASSVETNRDEIPAPFQGFPLSTSMQQLTAGSYHQSKQDLCVPAQVCSSIIEQRFTPFVGLEQSNTAMYPQQVNMLSQPHFSSMAISQKATSSFTDQSSVVNPVQKASLVESARDFISAPFQGFPLPASLQQFMTGSYQNISLGTSNYLAPLAATNANHSMASLHQTFGNSSVALNHPWSPSMSNHGASSVFQQSGLLVNPKMMLPMVTPNSATSVNHALASSIGTAESSSIFRPHGTTWDQQVNITDSIQKKIQSAPIANNLPSSLKSSGSFAPLAQESSTLVQTEGFVLNTEIHKSPLSQEHVAVQRSQELAFTKENIISAAAQRQMAIQGTHEVAVLKETILPATTQHFGTSPANSLAFSLPSVSGIENDQEQVTIGTQESSASKGILPPPVALHDLGSPALSLPSSLPSVHEREEGHRKTVLHMSSIPQHETLRSTTEALREEPDFFIVSKDLTSEKEPALESDRNNAHPAKTNDKLKEVIHPTLDKTPSLRGETPITATKRSPFSTRSFDSVPGDDDVLATILGRGTSAFKVLPTPKEHPVAKRPRVALRSSFKKRKIEFDILTVLHGDVIRQQLANTEDIRRVRKKAPCTQREIWSLNREIQGQQIFCEPSLPGISTTLHDLYGIVFSVNGAKLPSADLLETTQDLSVVEPETRKLDIENRCGDSGVLILEGFKENNLSDFPSEAICTPEKVLLEETVTCMRRDDESTPEIMKESLNKTLHSEDLCLPLQDSEELAVQIGSAQEQNPVSEAAPVHIPLDLEARDSVLQNGSQGLEDLYLQGSIFRAREESIDAVEQKAAEQVVMKKDVGHGLVDSLICNLMEKEGNMLEGETNREIEVMTLQGDIRGETQGPVIHSEEEMQGPGTNAQHAQDFGSFGTDVLSRQVDLQGDIGEETQGLVICSEEETQGLGTDAQRVQDFGSFGTDVLSRQVDLQGDIRGEIQGLVVYSEEETQGPGTDAQRAQGFGSFGTDVLSRQVDLQGDVRGETQGLVIYTEDETHGPGTDAQRTQDFESFGTDVLSRQVDLQSLQTTPGAEQDVLSRQVDLHSLQTTPAATEDVLSRQFDLGSSQTTPSAEQVVGQRASLSNTAMDDKNGDDKEMIGDTFEDRVDASKEDQEFGFISNAKDTAFLAADDDMAFDEVDGFADCASDEQDSSIHDNNGWSARTRNVGRYLKTVFEGMEGNSKRSEEQGHPKLGLGRLLMGKTRKEAARMFFETLVLKTREYIHVDQKSAFEDIHLYPRPKLMKTRF